MKGTLTTYNLPNKQIFKGARVCLKYNDNLLIGDIIKCTTKNKEVQSVSIENIDTHEVVQLNADNLVVYTVHIETSSIDDETKQLLYSLYFLHETDIVKYYPVYDITDEIINNYLNQEVDFVVHGINESTYSSLKINNK